MTERHFMAGAAWEPALPPGWDVALGALVISAVLWLLPDCILRRLERAR